MIEWGLAIVHIGGLLFIMLWLYRRRLVEMAMVNAVLLVFLIGITFVFGSHLKVNLLDYFYFFTLLEMAALLLLLVAAVVSARAYK